jgi:hypothetical protein
MGIKRLGEGIGQGYALSAAIGGFDNRVPIAFKILPDRGSEVSLIIQYKNSQSTRPYQIQLHDQYM